MTLREYEDKVFNLSVDADRLFAVVRLLDEHYFDKAFDSGNTTERIWWAASHDSIQDVMGVISDAAASIKNKLEELVYTDVERKEAQS